MTDYLIIGSFGVAIAIVGLLVRSSRTLQYICLFLFVFLLKVWMAKIIYENSIQSVGNIRMYSLYDSENYYSDTLYMLDRTSGLYPQIPANVADPGYHLILFWISRGYQKVIGVENVEYLYLVYANVFLSVSLFIVIKHYLEAWKVPLTQTVRGILVALAVAEPSLLAFASTLERELVVGLIALITFACFIEDRWWAFCLGAVVLFFFRGAYGYVIPVILMSWCGFRVSRFMQRHFLIYLVVLTIFFCTAVQIATTISPSINEYLFRHVANDELSGFGGYIQRSPPGLRVLLYGLLAFVSPIPIYPFLDKQIEGVYYFGLLIGLGGMIYLSCNVFVLIALVQQSRLLKVDGGTSPDVREVARVHFMRTMKGFIVLFICQLSFQGLGYNVRHKIQMIPLLILVGLYCIRFIRQRPGLSGLLETPGVVGSICVISALNILYLLGKVLTSSGQG